MTRFAAIVLVALVTLASLAPAASADGYGYKHFQLENRTRHCLHYSISWDGGRTWRSEKLCSGSRRLYWSRLSGVAAMIRFDADLGHGTAWRTYDLDLAYASYEPSLGAPTQAYHFDLDGDLLGLFR